MNEFLLGVVSSLVATFLIYISRHIWQKWWHLLLSRNYPDVSGKYKLIEIVNPVLTTPWYPDEKVFCKIKQFGNALTGTLEIFSGDEKKLAFILTGTIGTDKSMLLRYESNNPSYTCKGSLLARFKGVDKELRKL